MSSLEGRKGIPDTPLNERSWQEIKIEKSIPFFGKDFAYIEYIIQSLFIDLYTRRNYVSKEEFVKGILQ